MPRLSQVIKELLENAIDAKAKKIEVIFKNKGLDSFEVSDSGKGISIEDFENICLKGYTSKIETFEQINTDLK